MTNPVENTTSVPLPLSTDVVLKAFSNAANLQQIIVTPPGSSPFTFEGNGEGFNPIGRDQFTTPSSFDGFYAVTVEVNYWNGQAWTPSLISQDSCYIENYNLFVCVSEDQVDEDYNDSVLMISWSEADDAKRSASPATPSGTQEQRRGEATMPAGATTPGTVTFDLPSSTTVSIQSFANAAYMQRVTVAFGIKSLPAFEGTGYYDTPIGSESILTPLMPSPFDPVSTSVLIEHSADGGQTWQPSQVGYNSCLVEFCRFMIVASEDGSDATWDDATTFIAWMDVPTQS